MAILSAIIFASVLLICNGQRRPTTIPVITTPATPDVNKECQNQLSTNSSTRGEMTNDGCTLECTNTGRKDIKTPTPVTVIDELGQSGTQDTIPRGQKAALPQNEGKDCGDDGQTCQNGKCGGDDGDDGDNGDNGDLPDDYPDYFRK